MNLPSRSPFVRMSRSLYIISVALALLLFAAAARAQELDVSKRLEGSDAYMEQLLKDWNTPGIGGELTYPRQ
jgi:hypothetical protein